MRELVLTILLAGCCVAPALARSHHHAGDRLSGPASWYGEHWRGRPTANGERFNPGAVTCAHRTLPFNSRVRVTNLRSGVSIVARINDRGPYARRRVLDCTEHVATLLHYHDAGVVPVRLLVLKRGHHRHHRHRN